MYDNEIYEKLETELADKFQLEGCRDGIHVIRNEEGWRDNEVDVDYGWIILFNSASFGKGGIVTIKFNENKFRKINNPEKLVRGIFSVDVDNKIQSFHKEDEKENFKDLIDEFNNLNLFNLNDGFIFDGIFFRIRAFSRETDVTIELYNPMDSNWQKLEQKFFEIGKMMSDNSGSSELKNLFTEGSISSKFQRSN